MDLGWRVRVGVVLVGLLAGGCTWITRASVDTTGGDADGSSGAPSISGDGRYVAFVSEAADLVAGDGNGFADVFVRDLRANTTTRASVDTTGGDPDGNSHFPSISGSGRYVAFHSDASDLAPGDGNGFADVFVRDLETNTTTRASFDTSGGDPDGNSHFPSISGSGRYVAFESLATDLVAGDGNGFADVFVRDLQANTTTRASVDTTGGDPDDPDGNGSRQPSISGDGRYVAFSSFATDLVAGDGNGFIDVFVRDLQANTTTRVSVDTAGGDPDGSGSFLPSISGGGRFVTFYSDASDLVVDDGNGFEDVFVRDLQTSTTTRASVDTTGGDPNSPSFASSISGDGRYAAFDSSASDLAPGDGNVFEDVFVRDLRANTTTRASLDIRGGDPSSASFVGSVSGDGRYVAFDSSASDLVPRDGNGLSDVFVRAVVTPTVDSVTPASLARGTTATLTVTGSGFFPGALASAEAFTENGGVTVNSVTVLSETQLQVSVSVAADAPAGTRHLAVWNPGTGPGVLATGYGGCADCLTIA